MEGSQNLKSRLKKTTDKLQRVLNAVAQIVSNTRKYNRGLRQFRQHELHWLDVVDRVRFRVCVQVYKSTSVYTTWHLDTCRHSANLCPVLMVAVIYTQMVMVNWTSPESICQRMGDGRLPTPVLHPGTRCLTISRTLIFRLKLSNFILRHSSFPHTSTISTF